MAKLLKIAQLGHPILRKKSSVVKTIDSSDIQNLIDNMIAIIKNVDGVGLAAPQVYKSKRLFIVASHPNPRYPHAPNMEPIAIINPKIVSHSQAKEKDWEGCLSIPKIRGLVPRYQSVKVEYTTREGKIITKTFKDFIARIFQHEYDHLNGIAFPDRLETTKDLIAEKEYQKIVAKE